MARPQSTGAGDRWGPDRVLGLEGGQGLLPSRLELVARTPLGERGGVGDLRTEKEEKLQADLRADARQSYAEAARLDPERPEPQRELGLMAYRDGEFPTACTAFARYLEVDPDADDAQAVRDYLLELKQRGECE